MEDCVIVGGGIAGLSAANQLVDSGVFPLIIEASNYPAHRICGEFFSPECLPILEQWEIPLSGKLTHCHFFNQKQHFSFSLPVPAGSCSRWNFDVRLLERAVAKGARVLLDTKVISLQCPTEANDPYEIFLSNGQSIKTSHLMLGTGKIPKINAPNQNSALPLQYVGFKAHFEGMKMDQRVEMHQFDGGYLGILPIDDKTTNIACLLKKEHLQEGDPLENFLKMLAEEKGLSKVMEKITNARMLFPKWLVAEVPEFGIRHLPNWQRVFWIGDAAGTIPPICGEGLAIALCSGCMAADFLLQSDAAHFKKAWLKRYQTRFFLAKQLHRMMLNSVLSKLVFTTCKMIPSLPLYFWKQTRE